MAGKPLVLVYAPADIPHSIEFTDCWRALAVGAGLPGLHLVGFDHHGTWDAVAAGYDGYVAIRFQKMLSLSTPNPVLRMRRRLAFHGYETWLPLSRKPIHVYPYRRAAEAFVANGTLPPDAYPCVISNWDNTPRAGERGSVLRGATPVLFQRQVERAIDQLRGRERDSRLLIVKSWNEWAEGNYLEPDVRWGHEFLDALRMALTAL